MLKIFLKKTFNGSVNQPTFLHYCLPQGVKRPREITSSLFAIRNVVLIWNCLWNAKINIFNVYPKRRGEAVAYERLPKFEVRLYTEICKVKWIFIIYFQPCSKILLTVHDITIMYQSNRSFNIPPGNPPGIWIFVQIFVQIQSSPGRKAVQMPPPSGKLPDCCFNFSDTLTFHEPSFHKLNINRPLTLSNAEQSLCRPLVFNHSATNMQSFPLNSSKFVSAVSGKSARLITWNRG